MKINLINIERFKDLTRVSRVSIDFCPLANLERKNIHKRIARHIYSKCKWKRERERDVFWFSHSLSHTKAFLLIYLASLTRSRVVQSDTIKRMNVLNVKLRKIGRLIKYFLKSHPRERERERENLSYNFIYTYTWPISWAMVKAVAKPLSCTIAHDDPEEHILPSSANPKVSHLRWSGLWHKFSLRMEKIYFFFISFVHS